MGLLGTSGDNISHTFVIAICLSIDSTEMTCS